MKKILLIFIASFICGSAFAQSRTEKGIDYGLKAGINLAKYHLSNEAAGTETKNITNFQLTGYLNAPLGSSFYLQPGLSLQGKGGKNSIATNEQKQNTMWMEIPVNLLLKLPAAPKAHIFVGGGPYLGFAISGKNKLTTNGQTAESDVNFGNAVSDNLKGSDFGFNLMAGIQMDSGLNLGIGHGIGVKNITPNNANAVVSDIYSRVLSFSVGFQF